MDISNNVFSTLEPEEKQRASEAIYGQIRDMIISGELQPGDRLPSERHMMEQLNRSRPTIREALRMLEREGFIRTVAGSNGAIVQRPSTSQVEQSLTTLLHTNTITLAQLYEMRMEVEVGAVAWAAERRTQEDLDVIGGLLEDMENCVENFDEFVALDPKFHGAVARAGHNSAAYIIVRVFRESIKSELLRAHSKHSAALQLEMNRKVARMHRAIYEAIREQNVEKAQEAMRDHLIAFKADLSAE